MIGSVIRPADVSDVPGLLELIKDLADYEREPNAVENTVDRLSDALFGTQPSVFGHVAERDGVVVGCAIWFLSYSTWTGRHGIYLEDLIISRQARGGGLGTALLAELARICCERDYTRLEWSVLDWNEPALDFYRSLGAQHLSDWQTFRLSGPPLRALGERTVADPAAHG